MLKGVILALLFLIFAPAGGIVSRGNRELRMLCFIFMIVSTCHYIALHLVPMPDWTGTARGYAFTLTDFFSLVLFLSLVGKRDFRWLPPGAWLYWLYFGASVLSFFISQYRLQGGMEILKMLWMYVFFLAAYNYIESELNFWPLARALVITVSIMFLVALVQRYLLGVYQVYSTFLHQNAMALYCTLIASLLLGILLNEKLNSFQFAWIGTGFAMSGLLVYFTLSRGGLLAMLFALGLTFALSLAINGFNKRRSILLGVFIFMGMIFIVLAAPRIMERMQHAPENSANTRINLALAAMRIANAYPVGVGLNCFSIYSGPLYNFSHEQYEMGISHATEEVGGVVETIYLLVAAECGWGGLATLLIFFFGFLYMAFNCLLRYRHHPSFGIAAGVIGGLSGNYLQSGLEWVLKQYLNFYMLMLIFAVISCLWQERPPKTPKPHRQ